MGKVWMSGGGGGNAATATKLETARKIQANLGSTSSASFDGSKDITPGVTGTLPIANGGTGATTATEALASLGAAAASELKKYLLLIGGKLSGNLEIETENIPQVVLSEKSTGIFATLQSNARFANIMVSNNVDYRTLGLAYQGYCEIKDALRINEATGGVGKSWKIFGEHNKPMGSYAATNSTTSRTINTGGLGSNIIVWNTNGFAIVNSQGAICKLASGTSVYGLTASQASFSNGILTVATNDKCLNYQGNYYYYVL